MREFRLFNADGQEFDLMRKDAFFHAPSGLGFSLDYTSIAAGYDFITAGEEEMQQKTVSGSMVFAGYRQYQEFVRFCEKRPLRLAYKPLDRWYFIRCELVNIAKGEIETASRKLIPAVDFLCFSTWYESVEVQKTQLDPGIGKRYPYQYPYSYAETAAGSIRFRLTGDLPSYCRLTIKGPCQNPDWALSQGGEILSRGKVSARIPAGHRLVINSSPGSLEIAEYTDAGEYVQNRYQDSDFSTARFVILPVGESTLTFSHDGTGVIDAFAEVERLARTV